MRNLSIGQRAYWADVVQFEGIHLGMIVSFDEKMVALQIKNDKFGYTIVFAERNHIFPIETSATDAHRKANTLYGEKVKEVFCDHPESNTEFEW